MSMREQSSFSPKISRSKFVAIAPLGVRALNVPDTTTPFFSLLGPEKYDAWMADGAHSFTGAGNMRGPPRLEIV